MEVKNRNLKIFLEKYYNDSLTLSDIDELSKNSCYEIVDEMFKLLESKEIDLDVIKVYSTIYDPKVIAELDQNKPLNLVNMVFASMWNQTAEDYRAIDLAKASLGFVIFGTDFVKRLRVGYRNIEESTDKLEEQIKELVFYFNEKIKEDRFIKAMSNVNEDYSDIEMFKLNSPDLNSLKQIKDRILVANMAYLYEEATDEERKSYLDNLREFEVTEADFEFLPVSNRKIFNDLGRKESLISADIDYLKKNAEDDTSKYLKEKNSSSLVLELTDEQYIETQEQESSEGRFITSLKKLVSSSKSKNNKKKLMIKPSKKKNNNFNLIVFSLVILIFVGLLFTATSKKKEINESQSIGETVVQEQIDQIESKLTINRSGEKTSGTKE